MTPKFKIGDLTRLDNLSSEITEFKYASRKNCIGRITSVPDGGPYYNWKCKGQCLTVAEREMTLLRRNKDV
jgi:hypothetical protein